MESNQYYYCEPGAAPRGPLPIHDIRAAVAAGRLSGDVNLSASLMGPWERLSTIDFSGHRAAKERAANRRFVVMMVLLALTISGLCYWAFVETTKVKSVRFSRTSASDASPVKHHMTEGEVQEMATNCLYYVHLNLADEKSNESLRISLSKQPSAGETQPKVADYQNAKAKVEKSWDDFRAELRRLQDAEIEIGSIGRYSIAIADYKDYGIRLAIMAAQAADGEKTPTANALDEYETFRSLTLDDVLAGKYHGGFGEAERK